MCHSIAVKLAMEAHFLSVLILFLSIIARQAAVGAISYERNTLLKHANSPARARVSSGPQELYFPQQLDNFNYLERRTWMQRYFLIGILCVYVYYLYNDRHKPLVYSPEIKTLYNILY